MQKFRFKVLSLSIDDVGNAVRDVKPKQWEYLRKILKYFIKKRDEVNPNCIMDIKTTILDDNAEDLFEMYEYFVEELGCDTHSFNFLKGSSIQHADYKFQFDDILKKSNAYATKNLI